MIDRSYLPAAGNTVRCASHSRRLGLDPGGTALWLDEIIVAEVPLPWPKPVWQKPGFEHVAELMADASERGRRVRVLAAVPAGDDNSVLEVSVHRRLPGSPDFVTVRHAITHERIGELVGNFLAAGPEASPSTEIGRHGASRELLVCTQGSHDICCGTRGTALAAAIRSADPSITVRRVSHTGGHRFAPTALSLPDGRMWGLVDSEVMLAILDRTLSPALAGPYCRGYIGASPGPAQIAERAVMALVDDWAFDSMPRSVEVEPVDDAGFRCVVTTAMVSWSVMVVPGREVAVISCGTAGGLPAKPGREWLVESVERID